MQKERHTVCQSILFRIYITTHNKKMDTTSWTYMYGLSNANIEKSCKKPKRIVEAKDPN